MKTAPTEVAVKGAVVQWDGGPNILALALEIGAILAAYALLLRWGGPLSVDGAHDPSGKSEEK